MNRLIPILLFLLLTFSVRCLAEKKEYPIVKITYLFSKPDGEEFWKFINHDDARWFQANEVSDIAAAFKKAKASDLYVRIEVEHTASSLNNFYFKMRHSGPVEIFANGVKVGGSNNVANQLQDYIVHARRIETLGKNIYAIHFRNAFDEGSFFDLEIKCPTWVSEDEGKLRPVPVIADMIRDAEVCLGGDGAWYMTGTTGDDAFLKPNPNSWLINSGIQVFRSTDLMVWKSLGYVWTFDKDGTWNKEFGKFGGRGPARAIFAPEIKYHKGKYWINYSVNNVTEKRSFGIGLLYADKPEGPYHEVSPDQPLTEGFDSNLFFDDDGAVYLLKHGGEIARLKDDMSGIDGTFRHLSPANYPNVGYEGVHLFKHKGKYYLTSADWNVHRDGKVSYDSMVAVADHIDGPYGNRYCALRYGGHNNYFSGPEGQIYATIWCYPDQDEHWQKVSILKMSLGRGGILKPYVQTIPVIKKIFP
jgi:xylan 1,4-beta-xylosidase